MIRTVSRRITSWNRGNVTRKHAVILLNASSTKKRKLVSILSFLRVPYVVCFLLGISPASEV